jgi:aryl-alcohol dehydrogenase-like predicted oxidoreductase
VSEIGFGCARLGGLLGQNQGKHESPLTLLQKAHEAGINYFDTADMYTQGESETLVGKAFHSSRSSVVIATKGGYCLPSQRKLLARIKPLIRPIAQALGIKRGSLPASVSGTLAQDFSPEYLVRALEASLQRLKTDYVDLYQLHSPPAAAIASGEFIAPLEKLKTDGKIRYYGVAVDAIDDAMACLRFPEISSIMAPFGLLDLEALDSFLVKAEARDLAVVARGCFGGGLLNPDLSVEQLKELTPKWPQITKYRDLAQQHGRPILEMALQFSMSLRPITVNVLGMRTESHLRANLAYLAAPALSVAEAKSLAAGHELTDLMCHTPNE